MYLDYDFPSLNIYSSVFLYMFPIYVSSYRSDLLMFPHTGLLRSLPLCILTHRSAEKVFDHHYHYEHLMEIAQDVHLNVLHVCGDSPGDSENESGSNQQGGRERGGSRDSFIHLDAEIVVIHRKALGMPEPLTVILLLHS